MVIKLMQAENKSTKSESNRAKGEQFSTVFGSILSVWSNLVCVEGEWFHAHTGAVSHSFHTVFGTYSNEDYNYDGVHEPDQGSPDILRFRCDACEEVVAKSIEELEKLEYVQDA